MFSNNLLLLFLRYETPKLPYILNELLSIFVLALNFTFIT